MELENVLLEINYKYNIYYLKVKNNGFLPKMY